MTQNTRKDARAKVVSLNVRYKSATVDEFIENHSHDVSRGGVFVKTQTPFPPGTLLKFEIRIAEDQAVIQGVGRVVWKREPEQAGADKPAGMGVKFIKIDDSSTSVIERLVNKDGAGAAYTSEPHVPAASIPPPRKIGSSTQIAFEGVRPPSEMPKPMRPSAPPVSASGEHNRPSSPPNKPQLQRKATMLGIGVSQPPPAMKAPSQPPPAFPSAPPRPASQPPPAIRPIAKSLSEHPRPSASPAPSSVKPSPFSVPSKTPMFGDEQQEPTVMRQTAELLEAALKEAGGSLAEVGSVDQISQKPPAKRDRTDSDMPTRIQDVDQILAAGVPSLAPPKVPSELMGEEPKPPQRISLSQQLAKEPRKSGAGIVWGGLALLLLGGGLVGYKIGFVGAPPPEPTPQPSGTAAAPVVTHTPPAPVTPTPSASSAPVTPSAAVSAVPVPSVSAAPKPAAPSPVSNVQAVEPAKIRPAVPEKPAESAWKPPPVKPVEAESGSGSTESSGSAAPSAPSTATAAPAPVEAPAPAPSAPSPAATPKAADPTAPPSPSELK